MSRPAREENCLENADLVDRYFAHMRERNLEGLANLFAEVATFTLPDGRELSGVAAIREMYAKLFAASPPSPLPLAVIAGPTGVAAEIEAHLPDGTVRRTANFFHFNGEGLIERVSVYARSR
jgi:ketosteroid isomerase-like protein